jgi:DNA-binding GntR family transcriptional regulator
MAERLNLAPLPREANTYGTQSTTVLRSTILNGRLLAGERLNEVELATALGISRAPLREAIRVLAKEGLVVTYPNRGSFVRSFTEVELADLYDLRIALELRALSLACERASPADLRELDTMLDETGDRLVDAPAYPGELDFHLQLVAMSRSAEILAAATSVHQRISLARARSGHEPTRARHALDQHRAIVTTLAARDLEAATQLLTTHLIDSLNSALVIFRQDSSSG